MSPLASALHAPFNTLPIDPVLAPAPPPLNPIVTCLSTQTLRYLLVSFIHHTTITQSLSSWEVDITLTRRPCRSKIKIWKPSRQLESPLPFATRVRTFSSSSMNAVENICSLLISVLMNVTRMKSAAIMPTSNVWRPRNSWTEFARNRPIRKKIRTRCIKLVQARKWKRRI